MGGGVKSRLVKESVEYLRQKAEKATALKCAQFINSLLLQLQARVATSLSSDSQILWKKPTPTAQLLTLHCTVLDAASGKQQALDYRGGEDDRVQSLSAFIRESVSPACYLQYGGTLVVLTHAPHAVALLLAR